VTGTRVQPQNDPHAADAPVFNLNAVQDEMTKLASLTDTELIQVGNQLADVVASRADALWVEPKRRTEQDTHDEVRDAVTRGIALLAVARHAGVTFGGLHWCTDRHVNETCPGPGKWTLPARSISRGSRGAHFTPRELAENLVDNALMERCNYQPGRDGPRPCLPPNAVTAQRVCDPAMGSGALLVAACRFIAAQLLRSWARQAGEPDRGATADTRAYAHGCAIRCLYGADIDPSSVELARLALNLLAPCSPNPALTRQLVCGDALVGHATRTKSRCGDSTQFPVGAARIDWPTRFPEVYRRPDAGFDAVVSNPPFLGGQKLTGTLGVEYRDYLVRVIAGGRRGSADLAAYFALRAHDLAATNGRVALIATNTLAQGDTREVGLTQIVERGWTIYRAVKSEKWPGDAAIQYCMVWTYGPHVARRAPFAEMDERAVGDVPLDLFDEVAA